MKRILSLVVGLMILIMLFSTQAFALATPGKAIQNLDLPDGQPATVRYGIWLEGKNSIMDISILDVHPEAGIPVGTYPGWCIEEFVRGGLRSEQALLYGTVGITLPSDVADFPWNKINYVLNHKIRGEGKSDFEFHKDVQTAIWLLLGEQNPEFGLTLEAVQMFQEADAHPDFVPGDNDLVAVVVYSDGIDREHLKGVQETIIEVPLHDLDTPTATATATFTATATNTSTSTATSTPTATGSVTSTPTATFTSTSTATSTPTATGSVTSTPTATFTSTATATFTPTGTLTPPVCEPTNVVADFSKIAVGASVQGLGKVAPDLNIIAVGGEAMKVAEKVSPPFAYSAPSTENIVNAGMAAGGGFTDTTKVKNRQPHQYNFTFTPGLSLSNFSLHMLDFGDFNPAQSEEHIVTMTAYGVNNIVVDTQVLSYTTDGRVSQLYGDLKFAGDAIDSTPGQPGNWTWNVSGTGIIRVTLEFGAGFDPNIGFDTLSYTIECLACELRAPVVADFSKVVVGASVQGPGEVADDLNITGVGGLAVKILENVSPPFAYSAPSSENIVNAGIAAGGGFSDTTKVKNREAHEYTFTFTNSLSNFSLHMLDFGDFDPMQSEEHIVTMTAYDSNNTVVDTQVLSFSRSSGKYGRLKFAGDAIDSTPGQPGNWSWSVSGSGITRVTLEFGPGFDPNIGFDSLMYILDCQ